MSTHSYDLLFSTVYGTLYYNKPQEAPYVALGCTCVLGIAQEKYANNKCNISQRFPDSVSRLGCLVPISNGLPSKCRGHSLTSRCRLIELQVEYTVKKALQRVQICANFVGLQEQMQKVTGGGQFGGFTVADSSWRVSWGGGESSPSSISVVFDSVYSRNCRKLFAIRG